MPRRPKKSLRRRGAVASTETALYPGLRVRCSGVVNAQTHGAAVTAQGEATAPKPSPSSSLRRACIPLDQSPASVSVITSEDLEQKQIRTRGRCPAPSAGVVVVQTGTPGQLTSVFTRGLRSGHTQVLLDGVPINQGLPAASILPTSPPTDIDRIEVVRGPQSTIYGPRALAGVIQIFTKQGTGTPGVMLATEGGSYDTFREWSQSDGKVDDFDYSVGASRLDTENARPNNNIATRPRSPSRLVA